MKSGLIRFLGFILFMSFLMVISGMEYIIVWSRHFPPFIKIMFSSFGMLYMLFAFLGGLCLMFNDGEFDAN